VDDGPSVDLERPARLVRSVGPAAVRKEVATRRRYDGTCTGQRSKAARLPPENWEAVATEATGRREVVVGRTRGGRGSPRGTGREQRGRFVVGSFVQWSNT
jgi:hypothetical protein